MNSRSTYPGRASSKRVANKPNEGYPKTFTEADDTMTMEDKLMDLFRYQDYTDGQSRERAKALLAQIRRPLALQIEELRTHLRYVCNLASRLGPKAHNFHREEALQLLDGTLKDAEEVWNKTAPKTDECPTCGTPKAVGCRCLWKTQGDRCPKCNERTENRPHFCPVPG